MPRGKLISFNKPVAFLLHGLRSPRSLGAIAPSSRVSANVIAKQVDVNKPGYVIELGGGTGSITSGLLRNGVQKERLIVIEREAGFVSILRKRFPGVRVMHADASDLSSIVEELKVTQINAIVSVLPLLSLKESIRDAIVKQVFEALGDDECFVQLTYGRNSPVPQKFMQQYHMSAAIVARVWRNFPPAKIWRYQRHVGPVLS